MEVHPTRVRRLRARKAVGNAALAAALLAVGTLYLVLEKNVTLVVDGQPVAVRTLSSNVGQLLDASGIVLQGRDSVVPSVGTPLADGMTVVVDTGGLHQAVSGVGAWVVDGVAGASAKLAVLPTEDRFSAGGPVGPSRSVFARVVVKGKAHDVMTNASTVRELLSAMGIEPDRSDRVLPPPGTPLHTGSRVRFVDVDVRTKRIVTSIPFATYTRYSSRLSPGAVRIDRYGAAGKMVVLYRIKLLDGRVVRRTVVSRRVIDEATPQRRLVGRAGSTVRGVETGQASWYSFAPGSGFTAAHPWLPFGTIVTVTNLDTGKSIRVVINDRGPFGGRIIDLSDQAFAALAPLSQGVMDVRLTW
jgi:resuscitation-promoting factor RpfB